MVFASCYHNKNHDGWSSHNIGPVENVCGGLLGVLWVQVSVIEVLDESITIITWDPCNTSTWVILHEFICVLTHRKVLNALSSQQFTSTAYKDFCGCLLYLNSLQKLGMSSGPPFHCQQIPCHLCFCHTVSATLAFSSHEGYRFFFNLSALKLIVFKHGMLFSQSIVQFDSLSFRSQ